ncbi:MAG: thioredoxin domain-containing protein [Caldilineaceae bacterium]
MAGVLLLLAVLVVFFTWQETSNSHALDPEAVPDPVIGAVDAPIVITRYSDFGCPSCRSWHLAGIQERILAEYAGQVRAVEGFRHHRAAIAACVAGGPLRRRSGRVLGLPRSRLRQVTRASKGALHDYAVALDLDMAQFDQCMDLAIMERKVRANEQEAPPGAAAFPGFAINGQIPARAAVVRTACDVDRSGIGIRIERIGRIQTDFQKNPLRSANPRSRSIKPSCRECNRS